MAELMKIKTDFGTYEDISISISKYCKGDRLAIMLNSMNEGPFTSLTVNLPEIVIKENQAFVDTNNCTWAPEFIEQYSLGKATGEYGESGFCRYPLYEFDMDKIQRFVRRV